MKPQYKSLVLSSVFFIFVIYSTSSSAQSKNNREGTIFQQASVRIDENQKSPVEVRFNEDQQVSVNEFFKQYRKAFSWSEDTEAIIFREINDDIGQTHHRFKQYYKGIELAEVQYLVHEKEGSVTYAHGRLIHGLDMDVIPALPENEALSRALDHIGAESYMWENKKNEAYLKKHLNNNEATFFPVGNLKISSGLKEKVVENFKLVYRFDIFAEYPMSRNYVDVDARTGDIVGVIPRIYSDDVQGHGTTLYNSDVDIVVSDTNFYAPDDPPAHFHVDDWNAYEGSGTSWWMADTTIGNEGGYSDNWYEILDTDPINLNGEQVSLHFVHRYAGELPESYDVYDAWDGMNVRISIDDGDTWQVIENPTPVYSNESLYSFGSTHGEGEGIPGWTGILTAWTEVTFNISAYIGYDVRIRFAFASDEGVSTEYSGDLAWFGWQIDDIIVANLEDTLFINDGRGEGMTATNLVREAVIIDGNFRLRESGRGGGIATLDAGGSWVIWQSTDFVDSDSNFTDPNDQAGVSTHWATELTYDYFLEEHNRDSYDNNGARIISYVHYGVELVNAMAGGGLMVFGDGNGSEYGPLVSLDVVGHEYTHNVTQWSANLIYQYESGALNESFSDIFGTAVEFFAEGTSGDWLIGEDFAFSAPHFRSMEDPNSRFDPDTYEGDWWYTGDEDNGGVHINSGVQNFWFYLLSDGGSGINDNGDSYSVTGIGIEDAAQIAYRNLTVYLMPTSEYGDARLGALNAAIDLFGVSSQQYNSFLNAWNAVGVYSPSLGPYPQSTSVNGKY